jgi:hypothetical protein
VSAFQCMCGAEVAIRGPGQMTAQCGNCYRRWKRGEWDVFIPDEPEPEMWSDGERIMAKPGGARASLLQMAPGACSCCGDTGLKLGGWMGPTKDRPYPRCLRL